VLFGSEDMTSFADMRIGTDGPGAACGMIDDPDNAPALAVRVSAGPPSAPVVAEL
jgi:hypothetical protein